MYGELDKLPLALAGGVNENLNLQITLEQVEINYNPPYNGPGVVVRAKRGDSLYTMVDRIIPVRKEDVKPFNNPPETMDEAFARKVRETSTRIVHWLEALGVTREQVESVKGADFADWAEKVIALLPDDYETREVKVIITYKSNGYMWTPAYLKGRGYGPFVAPQDGVLRVMPKHNVIPPVNNQENEGTPAAAPW